MFLIYNKTKDNMQEMISMVLENLLKMVPELETYIKNMPEYVKESYFIKVVPPGKVIHQKNCKLDYFAFICSGEHRVINEFENGNIYMIEKNEPIDFVGEVTILSGAEKTSVTLETITECTLLQIPRSDFEKWIANDINLLSLIAKKVAFKLYRSSYNNGAKLFYPPSFILVDYIIQYAVKSSIESLSVVIPLTRQELSDELGISIKTLNRTIKKLKDEDLLSTVKGKISIDKKQYEMCKDKLNSLLN